ASRSPSRVSAPCSCPSAWATVMSPDHALLTLLQFADGLFPAGGFAHSFGLETYVQDGRVRDREGLEAFIAAHLEGSAGPAEAAAYLYSTVALLVGAGLRLISLGQLQGQRVLAGMRPRVERLAAAAASATADDLWSFNPALEIASLRHARLEARLFRS